MGWYQGGRREGARCGRSQGVRPVVGRGRSRGEEVGPWLDVVGGEEWIETSD